MDAQATDENARTIEMLDQCLHAEVLGLLIVISGLAADGDHDALENMLGDVRRLSWKFAKGGVVSRRNITEESETVSPAPNTER